MWQVSIMFKSWVFTFYSIVGARSRLRMDSQILHLNLDIGFHGLGLLQKMSTSLSILVSGPCMFYCIISCYLPSTNQVSGIYIAVVILTWVAQWLRLALSKGLNIGVSHSPKDGNRSGFWNGVFLVLEYRRMDKVQKPNNSEYIMYV
jgi:hypothetical protein